MEQIEFLGLAATELERQNIPWMLVGSYASSAWGEARFTQDIDIVVEIAVCSPFRIVCEGKR